MWMAMETLMSSAKFLSHHFRHRLTVLSGPRVLVFGIFATAISYLMAWIGFVVLEDRFPHTFISIWNVPQYEIVND